MDKSASIAATIGAVVPILGIAWLVVQRYYRRVTQTDSEEENQRMDGFMEDEHIAMDRMGGHMIDYANRGWLPPCEGPLNDHAYQARFRTSRQKPQDQDGEECPLCEGIFETKLELQEHLEKEVHIIM